MKGIVFCDSCKGEFAISVLTENIEPDIEKIYFICPHCKAEYTSHYTNTLIRKNQNRIRNIIKKYEKAKRSNPKQALKFYKQYEKLKKQIGKDMDKLRDDLIEQEAI